ncbi:thiopeptide-type bacteriocin biosynthesis protein [Lactobacillus helveticus]|uniref:thiopeptide-type bacteriocin biosynthesis protein n=1 Tax=Lactobacillus helveticus TaxID=1587 RepID=UPI003868B617
MKEIDRTFKNTFSEFSGASFVRYKDLEHHIRLRIFLNNKNRMEIEHYITDYLETDPLISRFEICEYFEISRYGGSDGTDMYEKYSAKESDLLLELTDYDDRNIVLYMALNIINIFKAEKHVNLVVSNYKKFLRILRKICV